MTTHISPMLAVTDADGAIDFYKAAFGAELLWRLGGGEDVGGNHIVAGLAINGARFYLATQAPEFGTRGPSVAGFTTVRIELFVDDPVTVQKNAITAGARELNPVIEETFETVGANPIKRVLQGAVSDPFGHFWLIGRILA